MSIGRVLLPNSFLSLHSDLSAPEEVEDKPPDNPSLRYSETSLGALSVVDDWYDLHWIRTKPVGVALPDTLVRAIKHYHEVKTADSETLRDYLSDEHDSFLLAPLENDDDESVNWQELLIESALKSLQMECHRVGLQVAVKIDGKEVWIG